MHVQEVITGKLTVDVIVLHVATCDT